MHVDRWSFNQIAGLGVRVSPGCDNPVYIQYERDYIADALHEAATSMRDYLGFPIAPTWIVDEIVPVSGDFPWNGQTYQTRWGYVERFGRRATTLISSGATVTYTDADTPTDGVKETATITVSVSGITTDPNEVKVFFRVADGAAGAAHEFWEIEPLTVTISGTTATITGPRALFVNPKSVWTREYSSNTYPNKYAGDTVTDGDFITNVDVYRVYADATSAVQALSDPALNDDSVENVSGWLANPTLGFFEAYTGDNQSDPAARPRSLRVSYKAGYPLVDNAPERQLMRAAIRYGNTLMAQQPNGLCDRSQVMWNDDRKQPTLLTPAEADNPPPFGISQGGIYAWSVVDALRLTTKARRVYSRRAEGV